MHSELPVIGLHNASPAHTILSMIIFPACVYVLVTQRTSDRPIHWWVTCISKYQCLFFWPNLTFPRFLLTAVCTQFIITTVMLAVQQAMVFGSFVYLADRQNALFQIVLYWTDLSLPFHRMSDVCSLINVRS